MLTSKIFEIRQKINTVRSLYAWDKKFLDFSLILMNFKEKLTDSFSKVYYYNPFDDIFYKKDLKNFKVEIFPDKLCNFIEISES